MTTSSQLRRSMFILALVAAWCVTSPTSGGTVFYQKDYSEMGHVWNTSAGICAAAATVNSLISLWNHFPEVYGGTNLVPDYNGDGTVNKSDHDGMLDMVAYGWQSGGQTRPGMYDRSGGGGSVDRIWETTYCWLQDFAPETSLLGGQINTYLNPSYWEGGQGVERTNPGYPEWGFLWDALVGSQEVQLGLRSTTGSYAHAVSLAGLAFDDLDGNGLWDAGETPEQLGYLDPNKPGQITWAALDFGSYDRIEFTWWQDPTEHGPYYIYRAFSQAALVPEPAVAVSIVFVLAFGFWRRRGRK